MNWLIYGLGVVTGIALCIAFNAWKPAKFDKLTDKAERKVKGK